MCDSEYYCAKIDIPTEQPHRRSLHTSPRLKGCAADSRPQQQQRLPPTVVDVLPSRQCQRSESRGAACRRPQAEQLDKFVLWRVEMSEEELIVIEERGGLRVGRMPWP